MNPKYLISIETLKVGRKKATIHPCSIKHEKRMKKSAVLCTLVWPHFFSWAELSLGMNKVGLSLILFDFQGQTERNSDFQSHFSTSKISWFFFSLKNSKKGDLFLLTTYFRNFNCNFSDIYHFVPADIVTFDIKLVKQIGKKI